MADDIKQTWREPMIRRLVTIALVAFVAAGSGCKPAPGKKVGSALAPPTFRQVGIDPSVVGLAGAVGEIVSGAGSTAAWVKFGPNATDWQAFPGSGSSGTDGGSGLTAIADQTVLGNISGAAAVPTALSQAQMLTLLGISTATDIRQATIIRAQALVGPTVTVINGTEFDRPGDFVNLASGTGIGLVSTTIGGGVVRVGTGTTTSSQGKVSLGGSLLGAQITDLKTGPWYAMFRAKAATAIDSAGTMELALNSSVGSGFSYLAVGLAGSTSTTNWRIRTFDHAGNPFIATAALAQTIDTNFHTVEFVNNSTTLTVYIDAVQQSQIADSSIVLGDPVYMQITALNGATASNREWNVDRMYTVTPPN